MKRIVLAAMVMLAGGIAHGRAGQSPDALLAGRTAGPPRQCLPSMFAGRGGQIFNDGSIVYRGQQSRLYLNRVADCPMLKSTRAIVQRVTGGSLCRGDIIDVFDPTTPGVLASCQLGDFVPYERAKR